MFIKLPAEMMFLMLTVNMLFMMSNHPMSMGLMILIQTTIISLMSSIIMKSSWLSFMLMITMISGLMVLFMYMSSSTPNKKFLITSKSILTTMYIILLMILLFLYLENKMIINDNYFMMEMMDFKTLSTQSLMKIYTSKNSILTIIIVSYLFFTMIISTLLVNIEEGPMQMKF
uniref:NADH dehydrogenase subunit 6 n=1 Tax=Halticus minutus TaxID=2917254 RepID=UPI001F12D76C|nr:NADH dehydrogenase subunit 6 [Halticus minutus]UKT60751.1 NADH dehydrogenase subunit 6 [Halticus minutus]